MNIQIVHHKTIHVSQAQWWDYIYEMITRDHTSKSFFLQGCDTYLTSTIHQHVQFGDIDADAIISKIIDGSYTLDERSYFSGQTLLHTAARYGQLVDSYDFL